MPSRPPTVAAMIRTAARVAPPLGWNPVDVLTKSAPDASATRQPSAISSSLSAPVSRMTLSSTVEGAAARTAAMSSPTESQAPAFTRPRFTTTSSSSAPASTATSASWAFTAG